MKSSVLWRLLIKLKVIHILGIDGVLINLLKMLNEEMKQIQKSHF